MPRTLPKEENIYLMCAVSEKLMAKDCTPVTGAFPSVVSHRTRDFIQVETMDPDHLAGATPGARVLVLIRRSIAVDLDGANPGRALAPSSPTLAPVIAPDWQAMPGASDMAGFYPERAERNSRAGKAEARCTVGPQGDLLGCWVSAETPADFGFGFATLMLTTTIQMKPVAKDGSPTVGREYVVHAAFDLDPPGRAFVPGRTTHKVTLSSGQ